MDSQRVKPSLVLGASSFNQCLVSEDDVQDDVQAHELKPSDNSE
jgi:hypothetical protein